MMKKVPKRRFKGFLNAGDWEQRKLGRLATVEMNKRIFKEQTTTKGDIPFYKIGTFGSDADSFISRDLFEEYKNKYPYPNIGDILISASGSIGRTVIYNGEDAYYQDSNIVWLNHNGKIDNSFLLQFYNQVKWAGLEGSTIKRLYNKNILETYIAVPKIEEQRLVGEFFKLVDSSITLHQRKLEKLQATKKALLYELFPIENSRRPKRRFKDFTGDWEQRKLGDVADVRDGTHDSPKFYNDGFPLVTSKNLKGGSIDFSDCSFISEQDFNEINKRSKVDPGDILFGMIGTIGNPAIVEHTGFAIKNVSLIKEGNIINNRFIYHLLSSKVFENYIARENAGGTQKFIALNQIRNFDFLAPALVEQNKIIELLDCISQNITLHQRKLEKLKNLKAAYLNEMFV